MAEERLPRRRFGMNRPNEIGQALPLLDRDLTQRIPKRVLDAHAGLTLIKDDRALG